MKKILLIVFGIILIWGLMEPSIIKIERISLSVNKPSLSNLKLLQLSDFHSKNFGKKERRVLDILDRLTRQEAPDFIFLTGDIVDWKTKDFKSCQKFWKQLSKHYSERIFAVFGNHGHRNPKFEILEGFLERGGIEVLNNEARRLKNNGRFFYLLGLDDPHLGYDNLEKTMAGLSPEYPKILIAHSPEIFRKIKQKNIILAMVGHTHGCQINLPILCPLILPLKYDKMYIKGLFKENSSYLYVNRGIGETFLPIRINSFPEITLIEFK